MLIVLAAVDQVGFQSDRLLPRCFTLVANQPLYDYRSFVVPHHDTFDNRLLKSYRPAFGLSS